MSRRAVSATINTEVAGYWRVVARPPGGAPVDITMFRGSPTAIGEVSFADPFGPVSMSISLPQVTLFDAIGQGDLSWLTKHIDVDVIWEGELPPGYPFGYLANGVWTPQWRWEGYMTTFARNKSGLTIQLKGAMLQMDNWLAKPEYAGRPIPYEWAIQRQFLNKPSLRLAPLKISWPSWWTKKYTAPAKGTPTYLIPAGVSAGRKWTGMTTRETGSWDPTLTSYIQTMLASMYTERGRWTIELQAGRIPELLHREFITAPDDATVIIDPICPDVGIDLTEDWESSLTSVYGQGTGLAGVTYSGMVISPDGAATGYAPLAAARQVYPVTGNGWHDSDIMVKEIMVQMQTGLDAEDAATVARAHLARFLDPGVTGTITLGSDPTMGGMPVPRHLVRAGMDVHIPYLFGRPEGVLAHVSSSSHNLLTGSTSLTVDSKRRDALTVDEVRLRGRDAMAITRMLVGGQYAPAIPDQLFPWSYAEWSGFLPKDSQALFKSMPAQTVFPWTSWTTTHPPSNPAWKSKYLKLGAVSDRADNNWIVGHNTHGDAMAIPIRVSAKGSIRMLQVAAYNGDGTVAKVPFHISFYTTGSVSVQSMPSIPEEQVALHKPYLGAQRYPFVRDGFETYRIDGTAWDTEIAQPIESAGLIRAYGTYYERAGHWPGTMAEGDPATGLLVDEEIWPYDITGVADAYYDKYKSAEVNLANNMNGLIYAMIYCDKRSLGQDDIYFLGRLFRVEPNGSKGAT